MNIVDNSNILREDLDDSGLHLNRLWKRKLATNLIKKIRELRKKTQIEIDNRVDSV